MSISVTPSALLRKTTGWDHWYATHYHRVLAMARAVLGNSDDAKEATQEAFAAFWERLVSGGVPKDQEGCRKFLMRICHYKCVDRHRRGRLRSHRSLDALAQTPEGEEALRAIQPSPSRAAMNAEATKLLEETIGRLKSGGQKQVLLLSEVEGWSVSEIAELLNMNEGKVWSLIHRGRVRLHSMQSDFRSFTDG